MEDTLNRENREGQEHTGLESPAMHLVRDIMGVKPDDTVVLTGDTLTDIRVLDATARATSKVGATPLILIHPVLCNPCSDLPTAAGRTLASADVWIEYAENYTLYSRTWEETVARECRYICLAGMRSDIMIRLIDGVEPRLLQALATQLHTVSQSAKSVRITSPAGTDIRVSVNPTISRFDECGGVSVPRIQILWGQAGFNILTETFEGALVFDGALWPPQSVGILRSPVIVTVRNGVICEINGGAEAVALKEWLESLAHQAMFQIDHVCYGFHPRMTRPSGCILADERIFGCVEFGLGHMEENAPSHCDGIVLNPSVWVDDTQIECNGVYLIPEVITLCRQMRVEGY